MQIQSACIALSEVKDPIFKSGSASMFRSADGSETFLSKLQPWPKGWGEEPFP